jgi:hypothetical protein
MNNKKRDFDFILDECLERILRGESVEECVAGYPEHADELRELLMTAADARDATAVNPRPEFRERASREFQAAIRDMEPVKEPGFPGWWPRWATVAVSVFVFVVLAGGGTVFAANYSLPDSPIYQVKLATEAVRLTFATSELTKAELYAEFADKRVDEIVEMADKGNLKRVEQATDRMNNQLIAMADLVVPADEKHMLMMAASDVESMMPAPGSTGPEDVQSSTTMPSTSETELAAPPPQPVTAPEAAPAPSMAPAPSPEEAEKLLPRAEGTKSFDGDMETNDGAGAEESWSSGLQPAADDSDQSELKQLISQQAFENTQDLVELLERVPESLQPALLQALEVANYNYELVIRYLE